MRPTELIRLLELEHPDQEVVLHTSSNRIMQILGINASKSAELGAIVLDVDWSVTEGRVVETEEDKLRRQRDRLTKEINKLTDAKKRELARAVHKRGKSQRSKAHQMIAEALGETSGRRTKEELNEKRGRGRPRKYKTAEELAAEKEDEG